MNFKVKSNEKGTPIGGFIFLMLIACSIFYFILIYQNLQNDEESNLQVNKKIHEFQVNTITSDEFEFGIAISKNLLIDQTPLHQTQINDIITLNLYEFTIDYQQMNNENVNSTKRQIHLIPCTQKFPDFDQFLDIQVYETIVYCPSENYLITKNQSKFYQQFLRLEGQINQSLIQQNNQLANIDGFSLKILYFDEKDFVNKIDQYFQQTIQQIDLPINQFQKKSVDIEVTPFKTFIQEDLIFNKYLSSSSIENDQQIHKGVKLNVHQHINIYQHNQSDLTINFVNSKFKIQNILQKTNYYLNLLTLISQVSALFSMLYFSIKFLYKFYYYHIVYEELMNETFNFDVSEDHIGGSSYLKKEKPKNPLYNIFSFKVNYFFYQYLTLKMKKQIYSCFCRKKMRINKGIQLFQKAKSKIQQDLDLTHLLRKLYEIDKLKLLLLNEDQLILFNSLVDPVIEVQEELKKSVSMQQSLSPITIFNNNQGNMLKQKKGTNNSIISPMRLKQIRKKELQKKYSDMSSKSIVFKKMDEQIENIINFRSNFFKSQLQKITIRELFQTYQNIINEIEGVNKIDLSDQQQFSIVINKKLLQLLRLNQNLFKNIEFHRQKYEKENMFRQYKNKKENPTSIVLQCDNQDKLDKQEQLSNPNQKPKNNKSMFYQNNIANTVFNAESPRQNNVKGIQSIKFAKSSNFIPINSYVHQTDPDVINIDVYKEDYIPDNSEQQDKSLSNNSSLEIPSEGFSSNKFRLSFQQEFINNNKIFNK